MKQEVKITLVLNSKGGLSATFGFEPALYGEKDWESLSKEEKILNNLANAVATAAAEALKA